MRKEPAVTMEMSIGEWSAADLIDPRGVVRTGPAPGAPTVDAWPISWSETRTVGLFSNKKPAADLLLAEIEQVLRSADRELAFVHAFKPPRAETIDGEALERMRRCDVVVLASAD